MALTKITSTNIGANAVTSSAIGYTPANKAGDTFTGTVAATSLIANGASAALTLADRSDLSKNFVWYVSSDVARLYNTGYDLLKVNTAGIVTKPYQPAFHSSGTSGSYVGTTSSSPFPFNTTRFNVGNGFNTSTYRFTAPVAGVYVFYFSFFFEVNQGLSNCDVCYCVNGSQLTSGSGSAVLLTSRPNQDRITLGNTVVISLSVNDYVDVRGRDGNGTGNAIYGPHSCFGGYLLG